MKEYQVHVSQDLPSIKLKPIISYPRVAKTGETYLLTIDVQLAADCPWPYQEEEFEISFLLETTPFFTYEPLGEHDTGIVLHRFGCTYGAAEYLLTASMQEVKTGDIKIVLLNGWGLPIAEFSLPCEVKQDTPKTATRQIMSNVAGTTQMETPLRPLEEVAIPRQGAQYTIQRYLAQYWIAADWILRYLSDGTLEWIALADPSTRRVDDFQIARNSRDLTWDFDSHGNSQNIGSYSPITPKNSIMSISGTQLEQLHASFLSTFPTRQDLARVVYFWLGENLSAIVREGHLEDTIFELIRWAEARGMVVELVSAALKQNPNPRLISVAQQLGLRNDQNFTRDFDADENAQNIAPYSSVTPTQSRIDAFRVSWREHAGTFTFSDLTRAKEENKPSLLAQLVDCWEVLRRKHPDRRIVVHLVTCDFPSSLSEKVISPHSFAEFIDQVWRPSRSASKFNISEEWSDVWEAVRTAVSNLSDLDFEKFIQDCEFHFGEQLPEPTNDMKTLVTALPEIVANQQGTVELSRNDLLIRLDWQGRDEFRPHGFSDLPVRNYKDDFDNKMKLRGYAVQVFETKPIYNDPNVIQQRWVDPSGGDTKTYGPQAFFNYFDSYGFRRLLSSIFSGTGREKDELKRICSTEKKLDEYLTFMQKQDIAVEENKKWRKSSRYKNVNSVGLTLEWYVAEWFRSNNAPARHGVTVKGVADGGSLDVVAFVNEKVVMVECKSGDPKNITEEQLMLFLRRVADFKPTMALLLFATESIIDKQIELLKKVYLKSDLFGSRGPQQWDIGRVVHVNNAKRGIGRSLEDALKNHSLDRDDDRPLAGLSALINGLQVLSSSVQLVQLSQVKPADEEKRQRYYEGALLDWDILAANADVRRDIHDELLDYVLSTVDQAQMLCLQGESGAGKSTLAWRLAIDASQALQRPLLHLSNNNDRTTWVNLKNTIMESETPCVILVDDIFRGDRNVLKSFNLTMPVLIIATTRSNEIPASLRLPFKAHYHMVNALPTPEEKTQVLQKLGHDEATLTTLERKRLKQASSWLVMMLELTSGENLEKIVLDTTERLQQQDEPLYLAYEYLCFAGQYDLGLPETLLRALDQQDRFYGIAESPTSQGLLTIEDDGRTIRIQHALIAQLGLQSYLHDPLHIAQELINAVQIDQDDHRTFLVNLLARLLSDQQEALIRTLVDQYAEKIDRMLSVCSSAELVYWARVYYSLHEVEKAKELEQEVLSRLPQTAEDFMARLTLVNRIGNREQIELVIRETQEWLVAHSDDADVRTAYLELVEVQGTRQQIQDIIEKTQEWLANHSEDTKVRSAYLELVKAQGSKGQVKYIIEETQKWLKIHYDDAKNRRAYLELVKAQGNKEQIRSVIAETQAWLVTHDDDSEVRQTYLVLVERQGSKEQVQLVIEETGEWLTTHPQDMEIRHIYLALVERQGSKEQARQVLEETREWLTTHPQDTNVRHAYLGLVERQGNREQVLQALEETREWLTTHPQDTNVRHTYLGLVERQGSREQVLQTLEEMGEWLSTHPQDTNVRHTYLGLLERQGSREQALQTPEERRMIKIKLTAGSKYISDKETLVVETLERLLSGERGYIIPVMFVGKQVSSNQEIDAMLLLTDAIFLLDFKNWSGQRVEVEGLNGRVRRLINGYWQEEENTLPKYEYAARNLAARLRRERGWLPAYPPIYSVMVFTSIGFATSPQASFAGGDPNNPQPKDGVGACRIEQLPQLIAAFRAANPTVVHLNTSQQSTLAQILLLDAKSPANPVQQRIGSYVTIAEHHIDAFLDCKIYLGEGEITKEPVWIKEYEQVLPSPSQPNKREQLILRHALILSNFPQHKNIVAYRTDASTDHHLYIILSRKPGVFLSELLSGKPLGSTTQTDLQRAPFDLHARLQILGDLLNALDFLTLQPGFEHSAYRDLRPDNIFVQFTGSLPIAQLFNLDCTKFPDSFTTELSYLKKGLARSPHWEDYASPELLGYIESEQTQPEGQPIFTGDISSDLFSWAIIAWELLTGELPFPDTEAKLSGRRDSWPNHLTSQLRTGESTLSPQTIQLIEACLDVSPASRPRLITLRRHFR